MFNAHKVFMRSYLLQVDFDKTKHLSEYSIKKRMVEREKLLAIQREREEKVRMHKELEDLKEESERYVVECFEILTKF